MSRCVGASPILGDMTIQRMDNVGIVVDDLDAAVAFFTELGMELEGRMPIEGSWAGNVTGLDDMRSEIAMMRIPGAPGRLELAKYHAPEAITPKPEITPANTLGLHRVMFAVDDIEDTLARLRPHGAELVGDVARYEDSYLLCYLRGPSGIILALAEQLRSWWLIRHRPVNLPGSGYGGRHDPACGRRCSCPVVVPAAGSGMSCACSLPRGRSRIRRSRRR